MTNDMTNDERAEREYHSDTIADPESDQSVALGKGTWVRFRLGAGLDQYIDVRVFGGQVRLIAGVMGKPLVIEPYSSNVIDVKIGD